MNCSSENCTERVILMMVGSSKISEQLKKTIPEYFLKLTACGMKIKQNWHVNLTREPTRFLPQILSTVDSYLPRHEVGAAHT